MHLQLSVYSLLLFGATGLVLVAAYVGAKHRQAPGTRAFVVFMLFVAIWAGSYGTQLLFSSLERQLFWDSVQYFGGLLTPVAFGVFVLSYVGSADRLTPARLGAGVALPLAVSVAVWIPGLRWLVRRDATIETVGGVAVAHITHGPLFQAAVGYSYLVILGGLGLLVLTTFRTRQLYQQQTALVTAAAVVPFAGSVVTYVLDLTVVDYTPVGLAVFGVSFAVALTRYRLLDVYPVPRNRIIRHLDSGIVVTDTTGRVLDSNPAAARMLDVTDPVGRDLATLDSAAAAEMAEMAPGATRVIAMEGDDERYFECDKSLLTTSGGFDETELYILSEVTDRYHSRQTLEERNERLDSFAQVLSHDLRNPLSVATGATELARDEPDPEHFTRVQDAHERMDEIIENMLTLARSGQSIEERERVGLRAVTEDAWSLVSTRNGTLVVDETTPIDADPQRLQQLFENLFRNSVEHGSTGSRPGADDSVEHGSTSNRTESDDSVEHGSTGSRPGADDSVEHDGGVTVRVGPTESGFYVADDGPGIPPDSREEIFTSGVSSTADGTGVGLAIVQTIVDAHGWSITVTESDAGGARFEITT
ncbi:histidine kinase N-terminal 7TM domain-containing protein [Halomicroarcula sp. GCM10025709]|uniref:sensor histidine kinase n=1 Tax=Haloarcula TaxID=2237 RepID=UPI0024C2680E|nr:histidine kinase N-terminal 7TM domain-containing protein [Halomicroarcula sp. YJ-61-S]